MIRYISILILCLLLKPQNSYSQSLDSSLLKELNKEFVKGIKARERVVILKEIVKTDSLALVLYRDSIIPNYKHALDTSRTAIIQLDSKLKSQKQITQAYKRGFWGVLVLGILSLLI
jgi:hypothetical protein